MAVYFHLVASCKRKVYLKNTSKFPANYFGYTVGMNSAGSKLTLKDSPVSQFVRLRAIFTKINSSSSAIN